VPQILGHFAGRKFLQYRNAQMDILVVYLWCICEKIFECECFIMQELFDKLMKLTQTARDDFRRLTLTSSVVQHSSNVSLSCVEQFSVH